MNVVASARALQVCCLAVVVVKVEQVAPGQSVEGSSQSGHVADEPSTMECTVTVRLAQVLGEYVAVHSRLEVEAMLPGCQEPRESLQV